MERTQEKSRRWPLVLVLLAGLGMFAAGLLTRPGLDRNTSIQVGGTVGGIVLACLVAFLARGLWLPRLLVACKQHTDALDALPERRLGWWIALAAGTALFAELVLVRWQASTFQLFAYYKNVSLLAAFLGLGIGYAYGPRRPVFTPLVLPAMGLQFVVLYLLRFTNLQFQLQNPVSETLAMGIDSHGSLSQTAVSYGFLVLTFAATLLTCIPLGHLASRLMLRRPALVAYSWNLLGSLAGIGLFTLLSYAWSPPAVWLGVVALGILPFLMLGVMRTSAMVSLLSVAATVAVLVLPLKVDQFDVYSPYQVLALKMERSGPPSLQVNQVYFQRILDLSPEACTKTPTLQKVADYYELPYQLKAKPGRVLVVGAGTGNDVAAGLRRQAGHIDAVEIDPAILKCGRHLHPEKPYKDPRVNAIVQDARTFVRQSNQQYDLIVYGLLDSHTLLSGMSSVRLDSFVYTVEGFREARARLAPTGLLSMTFCLLSEQQGHKFYKMLEEAFDGQKPRVFKTEYDFGFMFVTGPGLPTSAVAGPLSEVTAQFRDSPLPADASTDDWPFLYMPVRKYPLSYVAMVGLLLVVSVLALYQLLPLKSVSPVCFFLGAGFMLVETRGITELGLIFGNTWQVMSVVIAGILVMAFLANFSSQKLFALPALLSYPLLLGSLYVGMTYTATLTAGLPPLWAKLATAGLITLPLFFSGFAFSGELNRQANVPAALSSNLLGAMLGGFCEYNSMYFGFRSLYFFALGVYGLAFVTALAARWWTRTAKTTPAATPALALQPQAKAA